MVTEVGNGGSLTRMSLGIVLTRSQSWLTSSRSNQALSTRCMPTLQVYLRRILFLVHMSYKAN